MLLFQRNSSPWFFLYLALALSLLSTSVYTLNSVEKKNSPLFMCIWGGQAVYRRNLRVLGNSKW